MNAYNTKIAIITLSLITAVAGLALCTYHSAAQDRHQSSIKFIQQGRPDCFSPAAALPSHQCLINNLTCNATCLLHASYFKSRSTATTLLEAGGALFLAASSLALWTTYRLLSFKNSLLSLSEEADNGRLLRQLSFEKISNEPLREKQESLSHAPA